MRQQILRPAALVGAAVLAAGLLGAAAPAQGRDPVSAARASAGSLDDDCPSAPPAVNGKGSASAGDDYFPKDGNGSYDVEHYAIRDTYRPGTDRLTGRTVLTVTALEDLDRFDLDLVLTADRVLVDGQPARFAQPDAHELRVTPEHPLQAGDRVTLKVDYHGTPSDHVAEGMSPNYDLYFHGGGETIAMGEPQNGAWWFAANETPTDKATFDITVKVPRGNQLVSNGRLADQSTTDGWTTRHYVIGKRIVTYLAFFAAGSFDVRTGRVDGRPYLYAVSRRLSSSQQQHALSMLSQTPAVVSWLEDQFGPYPFRQMGGVVSGLRAPYALETATRPVYPYLGSGDLATSYVVHENSHQWFGDDVSLCRWKDVWLNEGFATYAEWLWTETHGGDSVDHTLHAQYDNRPDAFWTTQVSDPGPADMWNAPVYQRGAMMLAALRARIGDTDFEDLLRTWVADQGGGHGNGTEFRTLAATVSGENLDTFFQHWLDDTVKPAPTSENGLGAG